MRRWIVLVVLIIVVVVAWRVLGSGRRQTVAEPPAEAAIPVEVATAQTQELSERIMAGGTVEALEEVTVTTKLTGRVAAVPVKEGQRVRAGQVLVRLEDAEILAQVRQADANLLAAKARLQLLEQGARPQERAQVDAAVAQAQASLENAKQNLARMQALYDSGAVSKAQLDAARLQYDVAQSQYESAVQQRSVVQTGARPEELAMARAQVEQAEAALAFVRLQAQNAIVTSPLTGTVTHRFVDPGDLASLMPGQSDLVTVAQIDTVYVVLDISETEVGRVQTGQPVAVSADAYPGRRFSGTVREVAPAADPRTRNFRIKIAVANPDHALRPGMFARGEITVARTGAALVIPRDAVITSSGRPAVYVVEGGKARLREVQLGQVSGPVVQIVSGLRAGESVVVAGLDQLSDGAGVIVH